MDAKLFKLVLVVIVLQYVITQQISEFKCEESLLLSTDPQSLYPHLMEIVDVTSQNEIPLFCSGALISENFILTNYFCADLSAYRLDQLKIRKAYVLGEQYTDNQRFNIKRLIPYDETIGMDIGLVELKEAVDYHDRVTGFRPACLWTKTFLPSSVNYRTYGRIGHTNDSTVRSEVITGRIITGPQYFEHPLIIFVNASSGQHIQAEGSPMETYVQGRNYVVGVYRGNNLNLKVNYRVDIGTRVDSHIAWIESIVWPNFMQCGRRIVKHKPLMAFSLPTYHGEYPWHVALYRTEGDSQKYFCGGTIINNRTIITAAICVEDGRSLLPANRLRVVAGIHNLSEYTLDTQTYFVELINVHDEYNRHYLENDIALVKLNDTIRFTNYIQPICLGNNSEFNTTVGRVAGWGHDEQGQLSQILLQAPVPVRSNKDCRRSNRHFFHTYLNDYNYCGGYENGTNVCSGDSGGAMIFEYKSRFYIRGIVSAGASLPGSNRCDLTQMALFTDVPKFYNWIIGN